MLFFLQITSKIPKETDVLRKLPSFSEMVSYYGPFLGLVLVLIILLVIAQYVWYRKLIKAKDKEIERLVKREEELNKRLLKFADKAMKKAK
jgi:H+/gluconate symporter-like permease